MCLYFYFLIDGLFVRIERGEHGNEFYQYRNRCRKSGDKGRYAVECFLLGVKNEQCKREQNNDEWRPEFFPCTVRVHFIPELKCFLRPYFCENEIPETFIHDRKFIFV